MDIEQVKDLGKMASASSGSEHGRDEILASFQVGAALFSVFRAHVWNRIMSLRIGLNKNIAGV